jgi:serine/threonine protein kinase/beta-lactam-binding protein with PASTA domain
VAPAAELLADRYELEVRLGSGGMGDVYRARDRLLERPVAVKVPTTTITPGSAERFKREARAAARLNHPNVVGVYDWGGGTEPFIVMEFVEGRSLRAELKERGTLPPAEVAAIGAQIADALAHAHHHGVVHRDVKPSNVLLTPGGSVKVTDFGIAYSAAGEALTEPGVVLGTVGYLSPEQVAGLPADTRSDVYSLGIVLAELLTGERPTGGELVPSTDLERVIAKARAADPNARYQLAAELRDELRAVDPAASGPAATPRTESPVTAVAVTVATDVDSNATARATGAGATAVLPVAGAAAAAGAIAPPSRTPVPGPKRRRFRRAKTTYPKVPKAPRPVKPLKPPKARKPRCRDRRKQVGPPAPAVPVTSARTWKARHWAVILAAPLLVIGGGVIAYAKLTEHAPSVPVPDVVDTDAFSAAATIDRAGFEIAVVAVDSPRPGGTILAQRPTNGTKLEQGSTVTLTVSRVRAVVPYVVGRSVDEAKNLLAEKGFLNVTISPDYRDDVEAGTVMSTNPGANLKADKGNPLELVVAADPHVKVSNVVTLDQSTATATLQGLGLHVAVQTASSKTQAAGIVLRSSPGAGATLVRGDTITLTVSSGPKQVGVPPVVGDDRDDAVSELEERGFTVSVTTATVTSSDQVDTVLAQSPTGGQAPEGSTVTLTVGVRTGKG